MRVAIPIKDAKTLQVTSDIKATSKIIVFDIDKKEYTIIDTGHLELVQIIELLRKSGVNNLIIQRPILSNYEIISSNNIKMYRIDKKNNALVNLSKFRSNRLELLTNKSG